MKKILYYGGPILTMDKTSPRVEALLVEDGQISAVGTLRELDSLCADATKIDLQGKTLMPAFVDGHSHMELAGRDMRECSLIGCKSFQEILDRIRAFRENKNLTHGETIRCTGYDSSLLKENKNPDGRLLDSLGFDNPIVCLHQSRHVAAYNSAAMARCGVDDSYECTEGGFVGRDEQGHLTGYFEGRAMDPFFKVLHKVTDEEFEQNILDAQDYYFSCGITTIQDGSRCTRQQLGCYERLAAAGKLKADIVVYLTSLDDPGFWEEALARNGNRQYHNHLKIGGTKLILDGSPQARTAWMRKSYEGDPDYYGYPRHTDEEVIEMLQRAVDAGLQPMAHCNGDAASEQFLGSWEKVVAKAGHGAELRPVMIHAQTVGYDQLDRMPSVGMMASIFVGHCFFWGDTHLKNFGDRGWRISPVKAAMDRGIHVNFHQDTPITPPNMLHSVWCAVNRLTKSGICIGEENRIDPYDALVCATQGGAYGYFEEDTKGILRRGAVADLIILDNDPTAVDPMNIKDITVIQTIKGGEVVFSHS